MATAITPSDAPSASYRGLPSLFEYINSDGRHVPYNCGQAAACTFLTHYRRLPDAADETAARAVMEALEAEFPPDNFGGWFGTSRRRVEAICRYHTMPVEPIAGEAELRDRIASGRPVIVMLGTVAQRLWRLAIPGGHWMVAYGFDDDYVYLSNKAEGRMAWADFRSAWNALVPRLISMRNTGLGAIDQVADADTTGPRNTDATG